LITHQSQNHKKDTEQTLH